MTGWTRVISTHAPRTGSDRRARRDAPVLMISTHAPRTGSDVRVCALGVQRVVFQPTLPARGATEEAKKNGSNGKFQPTLPARGATLSSTAFYPHRRDFNPRSPHGERRGAELSRRMMTHISTHAPRTGSDTIDEKIISALEKFQPTLPARGATRPPSPTARLRSKFQPTLPARGATAKLMDWCSMFEFQPTLPARGATAHQRAHGIAQTISTHAPRTGSDEKTVVNQIRAALFQPTLPARGATLQHAGGRRAVAISTHAPRTGSDRIHSAALESAQISTHAPRTGSDVGIEVKRPNGT